MILDADKKEEEAARERPEEYMRAIQGQASGSRRPNETQRERRPRRSGSGANHRIPVEGSGAEAGDAQYGESAEEGSGTETPSDTNEPAHAQDLEEAERQRRQQSRRIRRRWLWSRGGQSDEPDERTRLLPPTYREATVGLEKRRRRRIWMYCVSGFLFVVLIIVITEQVDEYLYRRRVKSAAWLRGGRDGKGKYDDDWGSHFPRLETEVSMRQCDLFANPVEFPAWTAPSTSDKIFYSYASYRIPTNASKIVFNGRGSKLSGEVMIITGEERGKRQRYSPHWDPEGDEILIEVAPSFTDITMMDFHSCLFGKDGVYGVSLIGSPDAGPPVISSWLPGYFQFEVMIFLPRPRAVLKGNASVTESLELGYLDIRTERMALAMTGDLSEENIWFDEFRVSTSESLISADNIQARHSIALHTSKSPIYARNLTSQAGDLILWNTESSVHCGSCTSADSILLSVSKGRSSGIYRAGRAIDVTNSGGPVEGDFHAPRLWVANTEGDIKAKFSGMEYLHELENGGLLVSAVAGDVDVELACASGREPHDEFMGEIDQAAQALKLVIGTRHGNVRADITKLPLVTTTLLSIGASEGHIQARMPDGWAGDIELQPPNAKKASLNWPNGGYSGGVRRKLETQRDWDREWPSGDLTWRGPITGNVTAYPTSGDRDKWVSPWNAVVLRSHNGDIRLQL